MTSIVRSLFVLLAFALAGTALGQDFSDFRGIWVSRFEYNEDSTSNIQSVINNAADMGITDIMFQVRGKADSYYNSNYESLFSIKIKKKLFIRLSLIKIMIIMK